tara:strand:- start:92 stop:268 length:177 start_codon:yes stop_codon:yes gene_type:complete
LFNLFDLPNNRGAPEEKKTLATLNKNYYFLHHFNRGQTEIKKYFYLFAQNGGRVLFPL